jgi:TetR/AcrR family transcriptional regulator, transcriptional repressor for nem operon
VLREFMEDYQVRTTAAAPRTAYEAILDANRIWLGSAEANAGIMRCLLQFSDETPAFAAIFSAESGRWYRRIASAMIRRFPEAERDKVDILLLSHVLGGMMDDVARRLFAQKDEDLKRAVASAAPDMEALAVALSVIWYRALFACDPPAHEASPLAPALAVSGAADRKPLQTARKRSAPAAARRRLTTP